MPGLLLSRCMQVSVGLMHTFMHAHAHSMQRGYYSSFLAPHLNTHSIPRKGDVLAVFSQCGEIADLNLVRDKTNGKPKGFAFVAYEDQVSR